MVKHLFLFIFISLCNQYVLSQHSLTIEGQVIDSSTEVPIIGANLYFLSSSLGTTSDEQGLFSLEGNVEDSAVIVSYIGYRTDTLLLSAEANQELIIRLEQLNNLDEVVVVAQAGRLVDKAEITLPIAQIRQLPALVGEPDVIKVLQLFPGIQSGNEGSVGLHVRGGGPDQTLFLYDDVPLYNPSHLFGFVSVFNPSIVSNVSIAKNGFKAKHSGRLSSVVEVNSRDGDYQDFRLEASIGLLAANVMITGPIIKDKVSFVLSGRRSHIDVLLRPFFNQSSLDFGGVSDFKAKYSDINAKVTWKINENSVLSVSSYTGSDLYKLELDDFRESFSEEIQNNLKWRNTIHSIRYEKQLSPKFSTKLVGYYSGYTFNNVSHNYEESYNSYGEVTSSETFNSTYNNQVSDIGLRSDSEYGINDNMSVSFGGSLIQHRFDPGSSDIEIDVNVGEFNIYNLDSIVSQDITTPLEVNMYVENTQKIGDKLEMRYGVNYSALKVSQQTYHSIQPRVNINYEIGSNTEIFTAYSRMWQPLQYLTSETVGLTWDQWLPSTESIAPQNGWQTSLGVKQKLTSGLAVTVDLYYKRMQNLISYQEGASIFSPQEWDAIVTQGEGKAYGVEMLFEKSMGDLTGWVGYTVSSSNRRFEEKNFGASYPYRFDRRHDISIVGNYQFNDNISLSSSWVYSTGNSVTIADRKMLTLISDNEGWDSGNIPSARGINNVRMPNYHRFDFNFSFKKKRNKFSRVITIGAYNTYNRKNPYFILLQDNYEVDEYGIEEIKRASFAQYSLFPIIPSLSYTIKF